MAFDFSRLVKRRWTGAALSILIFLVIVLLVFSLRFSGDVEPIKSHRAQRGDLVLTVTANATLEPVEIVSIGAQVTGQIKAIRARQGERVTRGQELVLIDPELQQTTLDKARASLASMIAQRDAKEAALEHSRSILTRQTNLNEASATTPVELDKARLDQIVAFSELSVVKAQIAQAKLDVRSAEVNLTYTKITSPIDGEVLAVVAQFGQTLVSAQTSPTLLVVGNVDRMRVRVRISEVDVISVKPGARASFKIIGVPNRTYEGRLSRIEMSPDALRSIKNGDENTSRPDTAIYYYGVFEVDNSDHTLLPFMSAEVRIEKEIRKDVLSVPLMAVLQREANDVAWLAVLTPQGVVRRQIILGGVSEGRVEVIEGLRDGEQVVLPGISGVQNLPKFVS